MHRRRHTHTRLHISSSSASWVHIPYPKIMHLLRVASPLISTAPYYLKECHFPCLLGSLLDLLRIFLHLPSFSHSQSPVIRITRRHDPVASDQLNSQGLAKGGAQQAPRPWLSSSPYHQPRSAPRAGPQLLPSGSPFSPFRQCVTPGSAP